MRRPVTRKHRIDVNGIPSRASNVAEEALHDIIGITEVRWVHSGRPNRMLKNPVVRSEELATQVGLLRKGNRINPLAFRSFIEIVFRKVRKAFFRNLLTHG